MKQSDNPNFDFYSDPVPPQISAPISSVPPATGASEQPERRGFLADSSANFSADPAGNPSADTSADPFANPSADPFANPAADASGNPSPNPSATPAADPAVRREKLARAKRAFSRVGFAIFTMTVAWYAASILVSAILVAFFRDFTEAHTAILNILTGTLPLYLIGVPLMYLIVRGMPTSLPKSKACTPRLFFGALTVCFTASSVGSRLGTWLMSNLSRLTGVDYTNGLGELIGTIPLWLTVLSTVVLAPVFEELIFRKLLIDRLSRFGGTLAVVFSALMFGAFHGNFYQCFYAAGIGLVLGYVYLVTGKLRYTILLHALFNLYGGVLGTLVTNGVDLQALTTLETEEELLAFMSENATGLLLLALYLIAQFVLSIIGIVVIGKNYRAIRANLRGGAGSCGKPNTTAGTPDTSGTPDAADATGATETTDTANAPDVLGRGERASSIFGNVGIPLCLVAFAGLFLLSLL